MADGTAINVSKSGAVTYTGDAVELFRLTVIKRGLMLFNSTGIVMTRSANPRVMLDLTTKVTRKQYQNSKAGRTRAIADLEEYCSLLKSSIPVTEGE